MFNSNKLAKWPFCQRVSSHQEVKKGQAQWQWGNWPLTRRELERLKDSALKLHKRFEHLLCRILQFYSNHSLVHHRSYEMTTILNYQETCCCSTCLKQSRKNGEHNWKASSVGLFAGKRSGLEAHWNSRVPVFWKGCNFPQVFILLLFF